MTYRQPERRLTQWGNGALRHKLQKNHTNGASANTGRQNQTKKSPDEISGLSLIKRGQGITLVDFHGDFARSIRAAIPGRFRNNVIEFPPLSDSPIAFNPLFSSDPKRWPVVTDSVLSGMKNLFGHSWGPRLEQILQMALSAAIAAQDTTPADVRKMLSDEPTRTKILTRVSDPIVCEFWFQTFASWDKRYRTEAIQSVSNKLDALLTPKLRAMLCQTGQSFDFRKAFDGGKIVIVNLARGEMGQTAR